MSRSHLAWCQPLGAAFALAQLVLTAVSPAFALDPAVDQSAIVQKLLPSVVSISVKKFHSASPSAPANAAAAAAAPPGSDVKYYVGSGFVIDPAGLILTNYHVVEDAFEVSVKFSDGTTLQGATIQASRIADLAIVKVKADHPLVATQWGSSETLQVGDQVFVIGNPFGIGLSVSGGIVSALNRNLQDTPYDDYIQTDAAINHGNSGGPLFDMRGNVVGVNSELISPSKGFVGLGFAIPEDSARFVVSQLLTYGWVHPSWVGLKVQQLTPELANAEGDDTAAGAIVSWVISGGPAAKAGLAVGDVILRFDNRTPTDDRALLREIAHTPVGTTINLVVRHSGTQQTLPVVTEVWPRDQWEARDAPLPIQQPKIAIPQNLGLSLSPIAPVDKPKLGMADTLDGVMVDSVEPYTDAARQGMVAGDIILRVQDKPVATPANVQSDINAVRTLKRDYLQMLVLPKVRTVPGPSWRALQVDPTSD